MGRVMKRAVSVSAPVRFTGRPAICSQRIVVPEGALLFEPSSTMGLP
jgi:hypothetical protein